jgi:diketogulonate reductase-like aldo/keto reductase
VDTTAGTRNLKRGDHAAAIAALRLGLDLGMRHIDTAEMYGRGEQAFPRGPRPRQLPML